MSETKLMDHTALSCLQGCEPATTEYTSWGE